MEIFGRRVPSLETVSRVLENAFLPESKKKALVAVYYMTFDCNGGCWFCSQKDNLNKFPTSDLDQQKEILRVIRKDVPNIYLLGGEPTVSPNLKEVLMECENLDFDTIAVNTNGIKFAPEILEHANMLVVSLPSMDPVEISKSLRISEEGGQDVLDNIRKYAAERDPSKVKMIVNTVITGDNIEEIYKIADLCKELGILLNVQPAIMKDGRPDKRLLNNRGYEQLIKDLLKQPSLMSCSKQYLRMIMRFSDFACTPNVVPGIYPNGDVQVPCQTVKNSESVNIVEAGGVNEAIQQGREKFGELFTFIECPGMCHKTCYGEAFRLASMDLVNEVHKFLLKKDGNEVELDEATQRMVDFLKKFCADLHSYDFLAHRDIWEKEHGEFSAELGQFSVEELQGMKDLLEYAIQVRKLSWKIGMSDVQKIGLIIVQTVNFVFTSPFPRLFRKLEDVFEIQVVTDVGFGKEINRMQDYLRRVDEEINKSRNPNSFNES